MDRLRGKVALITGGARRIGRAIALAMAAEGADVAITYRLSQRDAERSVGLLLKQGVNALAIRCDVRDPENVNEMVREVARELGGIDVLVNNAGVFETATFDTITSEQWDDMFAVNARGPFLVTRAALPWLHRRRGRVINIASLGALHPWARHAHYCSSKAALIMLTQCMAKALAPRIAVNCIAPGMISTGANTDPGLVRRVVQKTPMKRAGAAQDVVEAALFFASATHFITGQTIVIDGGLGL